tara:strand:+ start:391 stop:576 length:186 start_codon:yes stop_codon:yes gene_type:complete
MNINTVQKQLDLITNKFCSYKVTLVGDDETVLSIPLDPDNTDYQAIQEWAKIDGNTIEEAD